MNGSVEGLAVRADGKILVSGYFGQFQGYTRTSLTTSDPDGSPGYRL